MSQQNHAMRVARCVEAPALPAGAMHHRQSFAEDVDAGELAGLENCAARLAFVKSQPQQQEDLGNAERQRVRDELAGELEWWISDNGPDMESRVPLHQEVDARF